MALWLLILMVVAHAAISFLMVRCVPRRRLPAAAAALVLLWGAVGLTGWQYFMNRPFRVWVNSYVDPYEQHVVIEGFTGGVGLPLPPKTAFQSRMAHEIASYYTRLSPEQVAQFYRAEYPHSFTTDPNAADSGRGFAVTVGSYVHNVTVDKGARGGSNMLIRSVRQ